MSLHKLTAGSGYDYLTRQVARQDATGQGHTGLADYYTAQGEAPGRWMGAGLTGLDGLDVGAAVTAEQMRLLFGSGHHPLATDRLEVLGTDATDAQRRAAVRLGTPFKVYSPAEDVTLFRREVARRFEEHNVAAGLPRDHPIDIDDRARIRTEVARSLFRAEHGRDPANAREISATIAKHSRPRTSAVAGYDLTFTPAKSVSTLWAVAPPTIRHQIEAAHDQAVADALAYLERSALFTRTGSNGVRQVDVRGAIATGFVHRDSRAGDPNLHTHLAVANKVQTLDGRWLSIDGRVLYAAAVSASETYNTRLEQHLTDRAGLVFTDRANSDLRKRPTREVAGVDERLTQRWSSRRLAIEARQSELAARFHTTHARPPSEAEARDLAQQATLETREAKKAPRSRAEQFTQWHAEAVDILGEDGLAQMLTRLPQAPRPGVIDVDDAWVTATAAAALGEVQARRAHWSVWHVRAEALRRVRTAALPTPLIEPTVDRIVDHALAVGSVPLNSADDAITEPPELRRRDGASVYTVAGAATYTSLAVLGAEARLVQAAARRDGHRAGSEHVDLALLAETANGVTLNTAQTALVRSMANSGANVQLAIAPAGTGKTTAMRALAAAWRESGGVVLGLAPSAAAADVLAQQARLPAETLAKLAWDLTHQPDSGLAATIGPHTLVLIDEAGMADTLTLDRVVGHVLTLGGSVRLVGDDQQLAAIGAGGVLRDIAASHGALRLDEPVRFTDPAEAAATLALRQGRVEALGFYLDHHRVHVGDLRTLTEDVFASWAADRGRGLDSIMLAPTRDLVAELNQRARDHRLTGAPAPARTAALADGNQASVGETVISRTNDRTVRISASDWVKNGDRWQVLNVAGDGSLHVAGARHGLHVTLPADYVRESVELGYATTTHAAQGVSADTMHGLSTGGESRQQLYTMLTRGRLANHVYLESVSDGDPHNALHPSATHPRTPTEILERVLARDDSPRSATTVRRQQAEPAHLLGPAVERYTDALYVAAEQVLGPQEVAEIDRAGQAVSPGLTGHAAWPTLRAHLLLITASGTDPHARLVQAAAQSSLHDAADPAAVLDWRLDDTGLRDVGPGPLPWLPAVPDTVAADPAWGPYLAARADLVRGLAADVRAQALRGPDPVWAHSGRPDDHLLADVAVWRAATGVNPDDHRPTGPPQISVTPATHQARLRARLTSGIAPALAEWGERITELAPASRGELFAGELAERLAGLSRAGVDSAQLLATAAAAGPLPDDHPAAALWWRIHRALPPAIAQGATVDVDQDWSRTLDTVLGAEPAAAIQTSSSWPALHALIERGMARGWTVADLLADPPTGVSDPTERLIWRVAALIDPPPVDPVDSDLGVPADLHDGVHAPSDAPSVEEWLAGGPVDACPSSPSDAGQHTLPVATELAFVAQLRAAMDPLEPSEAAVTRMLARAAAWDSCPVSEARLLLVNELTARYYTAQLPDSWAQRHLAERFGPATDLTRFRPGYAPPGWTNLVTHLRRRGVTDEEMTTAGVATVASTGRLIDRFRDRVVLPITRGGHVLGFVGRRHPERPDAGPKYLNTAETALFNKGAQVFGIDQHTDGAVPVLVEGPMDAIAVTTTNGRYTGLAPLGTSLTEEQATHLAQLHPHPVVATDADLAGQLAAERAYWLLTPRGTDPHILNLPPGSDPADLHTQHGPAALLDALAAAAPLGEHLLEERLANLPSHRALPEAAEVLAARPPHVWADGLHRIAEALAVSTTHSQQALLTAAQGFTHDAARVSADQLARTCEVRQRLAAIDGPAQRWADLALRLDPRLVHALDWPATAAMLQQAHEHGHNVDRIASTLVAQGPLDAQPGQDLRYRLATQLPPDDPPGAGGHCPQSRWTADKHRLSVPTATRGRSGTGPGR